MPSKDKVNKRGCNKFLDIIDNKKLCYSAGLSSTLKPILYALCRKGNSPQHTWGLPFR